MKRILILVLIIMLVKFLAAQVLPAGFKLNVQFKEINTAQKFGIIPPVVNRKFVVNPVSSPIPLSNFISDIISVNDTIWFASGKSVSRTTNGGLSFDNWYGLDPFGKDDIPGLAVYKNFVVVATSTTTNAGGQTDVPTGTGIKVSSDYGQTWNSYPQPMDGRGDSAIVYGFYGSPPVHDTIIALPVVVPQDNLTYSIFITRKNLTSDSIAIWIASWAGEFRKSVDYGATFTRVVLPSDDTDNISFYHSNHYGFKYTPRDPPDGNDNHKAFSITAENDSTIYVGTAHGINKSSDWGLSWKNYTFINTGSGLGISGNFVVALGVQRYGTNSIVWGATDVGNTIHAGTGQQAGFSFSSNGGLNWANTLTDNALFSHEIGFKDSIIYACTDNGIWRSTFSPGNFAWAKPTVIYDEETRDKLNTNGFYAASSQNDSIWVGSGDGLARTREFGSPWIGKWKIFRAHQAVNSAGDTYAAPNPFESKIEVTRIFFKVDKYSTNVTIKIFDFGMNYVKTLIQNAPRSGTNTYWTSWDGTRDDGMMVANGVYFYRIEMDKETTAWGKILVLN